MNGREAPIGVFDSGFDGLIVMRSLADQLLNEDFVYLGNMARAPYSPRPIVQVREFAIQGPDHLARRGVKALVIVYSSASSVVLRDTRGRYDVSTLEVILPAAQHVLAVSGNGRVGVVCAEATAMSRFYDDAFVAAGNVRLIIQVCPRFVEFMEAGITGGEELLGAAHEYLTPLQAANIDTLILSCTHYPLFTGVTNYVLDDDMVLVSFSDAHAQNVYTWLTHKSLLHDVPRYASRQFLTTGDADSFQGTRKRLLRRSVHNVGQMELR